MVIGLRSIAVPKLLRPDQIRSAVVTNHSDVDVVLVEEECHSGRFFRGFAEIRNTLTKVFEPTSCLPRGIGQGSVDTGSLILADRMNLNSGALRPTETGQQQSNR